MAASPHLLGEDPYRRTGSVSVDPGVEALLGPLPAVPRRRRSGMRASLAPDVEGFLGEVDRRLTPLLRTSLTWIPDVAPLKQGVAQQVYSGGKRVRAALCVTSCELFGSPYVRAIDYAAAVEHMQNFTLIHDDISDGDGERRGQPSIWRRYGVPHGINIGDAFVPLVSLCIINANYSSRLKLELLRTVTSFGLEMAEGQALDLNMRNREDVTVDDYILCTKKKTGAFLAMASVGGGIIGGGTEEELRLLREFSMLGGVAFQIRDDILDLDGVKGRAKGSDVIEGKRTLLVIQAARNATPQERRELFRRLDMPREQKTPEDVAWVFDLFRRTRAVPYASLMAVRMVDEACRMLTRLPESPARDRLVKLSRFLGRRLR